MGRPKTYDRDTVTRKAMELLWEQGYRATGTKQLAAHMGVNPYSLFAEFGSKKGLLESALDAYGGAVVEPLFGALHRPDAGLPDIVAVLHAHAAAAGAPESTRGCFMLNTAIEVASADAEVAARVGAHFDGLRRGFENAIENARSGGVLRPEIDVADLARRITASLMGMAVVLRAGLDPELVRGTVREELRNLERLRAG